MSSMVVSVGFQMFVLFTCFAFTFVSAVFAFNIASSKYSS